MKAVICDDEKAALEIIRHFIIQEQFPIEIAGTAENGMQALDLIRREKPQLVFMDIEMPFLNGFEVIQKIQDAKVIIITAYDSFSYAQKALRMGVCDIISKPIDFQQLREAIVRAVGWRITGNKTVDSVMEYIHANYTRQITLEELSGITFCTDSHISHMFKKYTGDSVMSYIHKLRIRYAIKLLKQGDMSIQEISEKIGYNNVNNFYKYFKKITGETPALYSQKFWAHYL